MDFRCVNRQRCSSEEGRGRSAKCSGLDDSLDRKTIQEVEEDALSVFLAVKWSAAPDGLHVFMPEKIQPSHYSVADGTLHRILDCHSVFLSMLVEGDAFRFWQFAGPHY